MKSLEDHIIGTYRMTRLALSALGFLLPFILMIGGKFRADVPVPTHSMSAYYHLNGRPESSGGVNDYIRYVGGHAVAKGEGVMRDWFVGFLFAIGILLYTYNGYSQVEDIALNIGGVAAWGVALIPMLWPTDTGKGFSISAHFLSASLVFFSIGYVCIFRANDTLVEPASSKISIPFPAVQAAGFSDFSI